MAREKSQSKKKPGTRQRLLESACEVFAEKGFPSATIAEICRRAGANIASVNYHFGSKVKLYHEVLDYAFHAAEAQYPSDGGLSTAASPEARLKAFVTAHLRRTFSNGTAGRFHRMLAHEFSQAGSALDYLFQNVLQPQVTLLRGIIGDLLPDGVPEKRRRFYGLSVISLCAFFNYNKAARERFLQDADFTMDKIEWLAQHITQFALAGIQSAFQPIDGPETEREFGE